MTDPNTPQRGQEPTSPVLHDDPRADSNEWPAPQPDGHEAFQPPVTSAPESSPQPSPSFESFEADGDRVPDHDADSSAPTVPVADAPTAAVPLPDEAAVTRPWSVSSPDAADAPAGASAEQPEAAEPAAAEPASQAAVEPEPQSDPAAAQTAPADGVSHRSESVPDPEPARVVPDEQAAPVVAESEPAEARTATEGPSERPLPPLSPPVQAPASAPTAATATLHDDSALRAAEAVREGRPTEANADVATQALSREDLPTGAVTSTAAATPVASTPVASNDDLDDTRITNGTPRSTTAWTPPPAPASPGAETTPITPTPYAPPATQAMPTAAAGAAAGAGVGAAAGTGAAYGTAAQANTQVLSPTERLGFGDEGIAGSDDGFTPEEMASRRAFRDEIAFRQKQEFAGINFGAAFFGWLASVGLASILYLVVAIVGVALGVSAFSTTNGSLELGSIGSTLTSDAGSLSILVAFLVVLFLSYFVGGFVASRMARFSGLKQGLAVWLWGLVATIVVAVVIVVVISQNSNVISTINVSNAPADYITPQALIVEGLIVVLSIGGALLGGLAGLRFHRRVDRFGFEEV